MKVIRAYVRMYLDCWGLTFQSLGKNAWTLLLPVALVIASVLLGQLLIGHLGRAGGFIWALLFDALLSCYLYFLAQTVDRSRTTLAEFKTSIGAYFWPIISVFFLLWIIDLVVGMVGGAGQGAVLQVAKVLLVSILLNPVPEVLYVSRPVGGMATFQKSFQFLQENWIEWFLFLPNLLIGGLFLLGRDAVFAVGIGGIGWVAMIVGGALLHLVMVYRGHLYEALDGTTHRQRMFKYRNQL